MVRFHTSEICFKKFSVNFDRKQTLNVSDPISNRKQPPRVFDSGVYKHSEARVTDALWRNTRHKRNTMESCYRVCPSPFH